MKSYSQAEWKTFWDIFDEKLIENGDPFTILHEKAGETTFWATVNNTKSMLDNGISLDFSVRESRLRVNIYIRNDIHLYNYLEGNKSEIQSMVSVPLQWMAGTRSAKTRRIGCYVPVTIGDVDSYEDAIETSLPIIMELISVCNKYGKNVFFNK